MSEAQSLRTSFVHSWNQDHGWPGDQRKAEKMILLAKQLSTTTRRTLKTRPHIHDDRTAETRTKRKPQRKRAHGGRAALMKSNLVENEALTADVKKSAEASRTEAP